MISNLVSANPTTVKSAQKIRVEPVQSELGAASVFVRLIGQILSTSWPAPVNPDSTGDTLQ
jgi:hypothetical protein